MDLHMQAQSRPQFLETLWTERGKEDKVRKGGRTWAAGLMGPSQDTPDLEASEVQQNHPCSTALASSARSHPGILLCAFKAVCKYKPWCHFLFGRENVTTNNPRLYHL